MIPERKSRKGTENRITCWLAYWFWESHASWPQRVTQVYSWSWKRWSIREYQTAYGRHVCVEHYLFWRTLWRATGMIFPACKKIWDKIERRVWAEKSDDDEFQSGM
jgi:hypothetical protein